jgi:cation-dependent mannose-6-phosphate receptor
MYPVIRGRKMVLNYTDGSPCPSLEKRDDTSSREIIGDDDDKDKDEEDEKKPTSSSTRRKTTIISMLCEKDPLMPQLTLSFVASPDECTYIFEARSSAACASIEQAKQTLGPSGVFSVILIIAVIVYVVGGCVYSRVVLNQRGWKQLPNYNLWAGIFGFFRVSTHSSKAAGQCANAWQDIWIIGTSSCGRLIPSRSGYSRVNGGIGGIGRGRSGRDNEAENRLIDELNEEWDD